MIRFVPRSFFSLVTLQIGISEIGFVQKKYCTIKSIYNTEKIIFSNGTYLSTKSKLLCLGERIEDLFDVSWIIGPGLNPTNGRLFHDYIFTTKVLESSQLAFLSIILLICVS
jgi:hypothetical protein